MRSGQVVVLGYDPWGGEQLKLYLAGPTSQNLKRKSHLKEMMVESEDQAEWHAVDSDSGSNEISSAGTASALQTPQSYSSAMTGGPFVADF